MRGSSLIEYEGAGGLRRRGRRLIRGRRISLLRVAEIVGSIASEEGLHATIRDAFRCEDNAVAPMYNQVGYAEYWSMGTPLGVWGGTCICPDGRAYEVGDEGNMCGSIACHGGTQLNCNHKEGMWSFREVFCNPVEEVSLNNHQYTVDPEVYEWGGECTCPDGQVKMNPTS